MVAGFDLTAESFHRTSGPSVRVVGTFRRAGGESVGLCDGFVGPYESLVCLPEVSVGLNAGSVGANGPSVGPNGAFVGLNGPSIGAYGGVVGPNAAAGDGQNPAKNPKNGQN